MPCKFHFLNVGYGSCIILEWNEKIIVVDCKKGDKEYNEDNLTEYIKTSEIELLIITHPHIDHFDGVYEIFEKNIEIKEVWITPYDLRKEDIESDPESYKEYFILIDTIENYGIPIRKVSRSKKPLYFSEDIPGAQIFVLNPPKNINQVKNRTAHDGCIVLKVITPGKTAVLGSDARDLTWKVIDDYASHLLPGDILNVSHHGAADGLEKGVLEKINPEYIILSSKTGLYEGIPDPETIDYYKNFKKGKFLRTDEDGIIVIG